ncbi:LysR family transcriptional regulator [Aurantiacibacter xanthus]|uniref:LysR family transcriptional regulator n=1 Tax=Aurantiacibacter xanthus TaxID=1784712 RepID=A0A3A1P0Q2_9SPHN|nr:LysR family transcriptional regulator [Aurantiacibacter xanthus]RIV80066.1 LysR family transcriptional regulator [Aurantiacibacter xanthus]
MRFKGLDLNLIFALDVLLKERSVSRTAERLNLSQPAVSSTLARLRQYFDDELLVQSGRKMIPTAFADNLQGPIRQFLQSAEDLVSGSSSFDPATTKRNFRIGASDYVTLVVIAPLLRRLQHEAPSLTFHILPTGVETMRLLESGEIDCLLCPEDFTSHGQPAECLFEDGHVIVGDRANPLLKGPLSVDAFLAAPQVRLTIGVEQSSTFAERHLRSLGAERRIEISCSNFTLISHLLLGTNRIAVVQEKLAKVLMRDFALASQPLPIEIPPLVEMAQYHSTRASDASLRWLLDQLRSESNRLL